MAIFKTQFTKLILTFFCASALFACFPEDEAVPPYISPEGVVNNQVSLGKYYTRVAYYSLKTNQFISTAEYNSWDIAFNSDANRYEIIVNSHKGMRVGHTSKTYEDVASIQDVDFWSYDKSGDSYSENTAIGTWWKDAGETLDSAYILDLGKDAITGNSLGQRKIKIANFENGKYHLTVANLNGSQERTIEIGKNSQYNLVHYSFTTNEQVMIEPVKTEWDLLFGQYMTVLYDGGNPLDYSVNGVLINAKNGVQVAIDKEKSLEDIKVSDLPSYTFSDAQDIIGHTWKYLGSINGPIVYTIQPWVFIIKNVDGEYYKLRFTSFTDEIGEKGNPAFEVGKF